MSQVSGTTSTANTASVSQDQYLQLLVAQLQNQDPMNPVDDQQFITQLTSLNTLSGIQTLNANFSDMLKLQQLTQGTALIGKTVDYTPSSGGATASGTVSSLAVSDGKFVLQVGTTQVGLDQVSAVHS